MSNQHFPSAELAHIYRLVREARSGLNRETQRAVWQALDSALARLEGLGIIYHPGAVQEKSDEK
jgi:hypothetical protein